MYLKSPYPDPPPLPDVNCEYIFFKRPDQAEWPNFTAHIDPETDERIMWRDFLARVEDLATGLGTSVSEGGLGLRREDGHVIGILGENSSVSVPTLRPCKQANPDRMVSPFRNISRWFTAVYILRHRSLCCHRMRHRSSSSTP